MDNYFKSKIISSGDIIKSNTVIEFHLMSNLTKNNHKNMQMLFVDYFVKFTNEGTIIITRKIGKVTSEISSLGIKNELVVPICNRKTDESVYLMNKNGLYFLSDKCSWYLNIGGSDSIYVSNDNLRLFDMDFTDENGINLTKNQFNNGKNFHLILDSGYSKEPRNILIRNLVTKSVMDKLKENRELKFSEQV